jgi:hypothetical protein
MNIYVVYVGYIILFCVWAAEGNEYIKLTPVESSAPALSIKKIFRYVVYTVHIGAAHTLSSI